MMLSIIDDRVLKIVPETITPEVVVSGFDFTEGPIWHPAKKQLIFSDILGNSMYVWEQGNLKQLRRNSYLANGNAFDHQGRVVTCEHGTSRLTRTDFEIPEKIDVLATHYNGKQLNSPNDVVVKRDGSIYFTDPTSGRSAGYGIPREPELSFSGVYRWQDGELALLIDDFAKPNGLCFSEDESLLFINDTVRQHIRVFDVNSGGTISNSRLFTELQGDAPGVADGMKIDQESNVYCCGPGGIHIFDAAATWLGVIHIPEYTTNFVFGDEDYCTLYITASTSIYKVRVHVPGVPTFIP